MGSHFFKCKKPKCTLKELLLTVIVPLVLTENIPSLSPMEDIWKTSTVPVLCLNAFQNSTEVNLSLQQQVDIFQNDCIFSAEFPLPALSLHHSSARKYMEKGGI